MTALTSNQLFTMPDTDFDTAIKGMSTKSLIDTITVLQKEMSKEQENFNSLSSELGGLKKNSGQYKSISKDLSSSQTRLTLLMNRSLKCFNQQGTKSKTPTEKTAPKISVNKASDQNKPVIVTQSAANRAPVQANGAAKPVNRSASTSNGKTMIKVQSLTQNSPRLQIGDVNSSNNDSMNKLSFGEKKGIVSNALPLSQSAGNLESLRMESPRTPVDNEPKSFTNGKLGTVVTSKSKEDVSSVVKTGPIDDQRSKYISSSADNVNKPDAVKPEVVKSSIKPTQPATKVVLNSDKHMIDLDSFTDRKNMLSELKSFDKQLKPVQKSTIVNQVKLSVGETNGNKDDTTVSAKVNGTEKANPKSVLLRDIQLAKKPSELKETKAKPVKQTWNGNDKTKDKTISDNATKMFNDLFKGVDSATDSESSENSPREVIIVDTKKVEPQKVETKVIEAVKEVEMDIPKGVDTKSAPLSEISFAGTRQVTTIEEESEDNGTDSEDDRFVSEFQFPGKPKSTEKAKQKTEPQKAPVSNKVTTAKQTIVNDAGGAISKVQTQPSNGAPKPTTPTSQGQSTTPIVQGQGQDDVDGEELVKDTRVKFKEWDPAPVLRKLYDVKMMPDNIEDISHKFIGMEGLMEKLPMNKKKATLLKTWKRRFFRAQDGWLHYYEVSRQTSARDKPSDSLQLMGGKVEELGPRVLGVDDGRGKYLMVRVPTDHEYGLWKVALESQTADNVKATYVRPAPASIPNPKKRVVIIDIGSSAIRAGILGERPTLPQVFFPSVVAVNKQSGEIIVGPDALKPEVRRTSNIIQPIQPTNKVDKFNIDMTVMLAILKKVFSELRIDQSNYMIMLSTPQNLGDKLKESLMGILIDQLHVKGACLVQQSLLALYSYNTISGIIVDIGERLEIMPIYEGVLIEGGVSRQAYGGAKIQDSLYISLLENRYQFNTQVEKYLVRYICEQSCYVSPNYKENKSQCDKEPESYRRTVDLSDLNLPENAHSTVDLDYACFKSPEGFFNTDLWEMDYRNLQKQIYAAIQQCPMDSRKHMYRSVYLSGGVTTLPGFADRLQEELKKLSPPSVLVEVHASPQRYHAAYIGACAVASMAEFEASCVSADEWKKLGVKACRKWGTN